MKHLYCAHIISTFFYRNKVPKQHEWVVEEAYVAIIAKNDAAAHLESHRIGNESYSMDDLSLTLNKIPVRQQFLGVRKIIRADITDTKFISTNQLHGVEMTFSNYVVKDKLSLRKLVQGKDVSVFYLRYP